MKNISYWKIKKLIVSKYAYFFFSNNQPSIIQQIHHISFTDLQFLNLGMNNIFSIEKLATVHMPNIETIRICCFDHYSVDNRLTCIKPLRKVLWLKLISLTFDGNFLNELSSAGEFSMPKLVSIFVEYFAKDPHQCGSIVSVCKLETRCLSTICTFLYKRKF